MAQRLRRLSAPSAGRGAWVALALLLALAALFAQALPSERLDWRPALALAQPWRWWSAAFVHWSAQHLLANLAGCAVVAAFGWTARLPARAVGAWALAWPLTQLGLLAQPTLQVYGGLSGVLHAGVAVAAAALLRRPGRREPLVGAAVLAGLGVKLLLEAPWRGPLREVQGWDIALAPAAHLSGVLAGLLAWAVLQAWASRSGSRRPGHAPGVDP